MDNLKNNNGLMVHQAGLHGWYTDFDVWVTHFKEVCKQRSLMLDNMKENLRRYEEFNKLQLENAMVEGILLNKLQKRHLERNFGQTPNNFSIFHHIFGLTDDSDRFLLLNNMKAHLHSNENVRTKYEEFDKIQLENAMVEGIFVNKLKRGDPETNFSQNTHNLTSYHTCGLNDDSEKCKYYYKYNRSKL